MSTSSYISRMTKGYTQQFVIVQTLFPGRFVSELWRASTDVGEEKKQE